MPTTMSRDEPNDTDRIARINQAVRHEALLSTLRAVSPRRRAKARPCRFLTASLFALLGDIIATNMR
jgi:hypothetical protein